MAQPFPDLVQPAVPDRPWRTLAAPYGQVCDLYRELTAQLSAAEQHAIFGHTARRVYRLR